MQEIKNRICWNKTDKETGEIFYLAMEYTGKDQDGNDTVSMKTLRKMFRLETYMIKSKVSKEQIADLEKLHSVDPKAMLISTMEEEDKRGQDKLIYNMIKYAGSVNEKIGWSAIVFKANEWFGYQPKFRIKEDTDIFGKLVSISNLIQSTSRRSEADFIIVGPAMGARIMNLPQFVYNDPNQPDLDRSTGLVHKVGSLGNRFSVIINPILNWNDESIVMGSNTFEGQEGIYQYEMEPEIIETEEINPNNFMPNVILHYKKGMALVATDNAHLKYYTLNTTTKRHNIITHLLNKIFKK
jgi:hypothetical protein